MTSKSNVFSFPAILALEDIRIYVNILYGGNVTFYIEALID